MKKFFILSTLCLLWQSLLFAQDFKDLLSNYPEISLTAAQLSESNLISFAPDTDFIAKLSSGQDLIKDTVKLPLYFNALPQEYRHLATQFSIVFGSTGKSERGTLLRIANPASEQGPKSQYYRELLNINLAGLNKDLSFMNFRDLTSTDAIWQSSPFSNTVRRLDQANRQDPLLGSNLSLNDFFVWSENPANFQILNFEDDKARVLIDPTPWKVIEREGCLNLSNPTSSAVAYQYSEIPVKKLQLFSEDIFTRTQKEQVVFNSQGLAIEKTLLSPDSKDSQKVYAVLKAARLNDGREIYFYSDIFILSVNSKTKISFEQVNFCPQKTAELGFSGIDPSKVFSNKESEIIKP